MINKMGVRFLLGLLYVLFAYSSAVADNGYYVGARTGVSIQDYNDVKFVNPRITTGVKSDNDAEAQGLISIQLGKTLSDPRLRVEVEYARTVSTSNFDRYYNNFPDTRQRIKSKSQRVMFNGYYNVTEVEELGSLFVSGGLGVAFNSTDATQGTSSEFIEETSTNVAWSLGAGVSRALVERWALDVGYRYVN